MKTITSLITVLAVVVIVVAAWLASPRPDDTGSTLRLSSAAKDFGTVAPGQRLQDGFSVRNRGSRRLILHQDGASCCGQATPEPLIASPGQTINVPVDVLAPTQPGPFEQTLSFTTNDPSRPRFEFVLRGLVSQPPSQ